MEEVNPMFSAPIAGQSLTAEVGSQPWQKPPKLVTVQDAADYYMKRILNPEALPILMDMMESGLALVVIADIFQTSSVMEGIHSLDVGILVIPVIMEALVYVAEENDIKYVLGTEKQKNKDKLSPTAIAHALSTLDKDKPKVKMAEQLVEEVPEVATEAPASGLMARRV